MFFFLIDKYKNILLQLKVETGKLQDAVSKASSSLYANHVNGGHVKTQVQMLQVKQRIKLYLKLWKLIN